MAERVLGILRELERADEEIGVVLADLDRLAGQLDVLRTRVADLQAFEERLLSNRERLAADLERTRAESDSAREALGKAHEAVRTAKPATAREAELFEVRARDRVTSADRRCREAEARVAALEREVQEAQHEAGELHAEAQAIAGELAERPRLARDAGREPGVGLDGVAVWSEVARAALFVAHGQVTAEREAVIRQANELGAVALGEPLTSASAAVVTRRVEQAPPK